ncbi:uncharacterized protein [Venturia canescens]|uniref:uncharacterized protein isoform X1 n=1 Tax=Venturia canescens TaxID=32260 RepID=UPI001C9BEBFA|nr:uncharacterized protein LOC122413472 isoform X1 [Venturia canescens]
MNNRVKFINQKRATLKTQITKLERIVETGELDPSNIKTRADRLREQFRTYEELHDELALLIETEGDQSDDFDELQDRFYAIITKIEADFSSTMPQPPSALNTTSLPIDGTRRLKLPVADLPKFDGNIEKWLSFKNTFLTMIDSREDVTRLQKFLYLRNCLEGDALNKILIYNVSEENYETAWKLLLDSYDKIRILIVKHLDAILDLPALTKATHQGLARLVDDMRQHVNMLASMKVTPDEHLLVRIIERALPNNIRVKWEETLNLDTPPTLQQIYKFVSEAAFRLCALEQNTSRSNQETNIKRPLSNNKDQSGFKTRRGENGVRTLATGASAKCIVCKKENHPVYQCRAFQKMTVQQRWDFVKNSTLCKNCLRLHGGKCKATHCRSCPRFHHTMLHQDSPAALTHTSQKAEESSNTINDSTTKVCEPNSSRRRNRVIGNQ